MTKCLVTPVTVIYSPISCDVRFRNVADVTLMSAFAPKADVRNLMFGIVT